MDDLRIFQVKANWTVFRIPTTNEEVAGIYMMLNMWLEENCTSIYKIFDINCGNKGRGSFGASIYSRLIQIDLLDDVDVLAFKLRWL